MNPASAYPTFRCESGPALRLNTEIGLFGPTLPGGTLNFEFLVRQGKAPAVEAAYLTVEPRSDKPVATSKRLDGDKIVIDFDVEGRFLGIEVLGFLPPEKAPETVKMMRDGDPLLRAAVVTTMRYWERFLKVFAVAPEIYAYFFAPQARPFPQFTQQPEPQPWENAPHLAEQLIPAGVGW